MGKTSPAILDYATRKFEFGETVPIVEKERSDDESHIALVNYVRSQMIGEHECFSTPYGSRKMIYCDFTASGKPLQFIEDYIQKQVLPFYGNTHTTTSITGRQSTFFRHEARELIKHAVHGNENDVLLFTGTGATSAIHKLISSLGLDHLQKGDLVVFVGPYEHHSNLLPWRELGAKVINIPEDEIGRIDIKVLENELQEHLHYRVKIGAFSAASNITGVISDEDSITACLHRYEALAFWDYAAAGPYVPVDMNPLKEGPDRHLIYKDAIFLSPHKFIGGPGCPGILIAKRKLFQRPTPKECGGGTVFFVTRKDHRYLTSIEEREEGGTPDIIGSIKCGLVFQLKQQIGDEFIRRRELELLTMARNYLDDVPGFILLGPKNIDRLPILSFLIKHEASGLYLHHNYVCALLNDIFGIQVRGGCVCAGPYAQELLGIDYEKSKKFEDALLHFSSNDSELETLLPRERDRQGAGTELLRPGFVRLNFHYTMDDKSIQFVLYALKMISIHGWKLLPQYKFNTETGECLHDNWSLQKNRKWLGSIKYFQPDGSVGFTVPEFQHHPGKASKIPSQNINLPEDSEEYFNYCIEESENLFNSASPSSNNFSMELLFNDDAKELRWFLLPSEANEYLKNPSLSNEIKTPICIKTYSTSIKEEKVEKTEELNEEKSILNESPSTDIMLNDTDDLFDDFVIDTEDTNDSLMNINNGFRFHIPSKKIIHTALSAMEEFNMIQDGDRVIACISGGKDSLSMLHFLKHYQYYIKPKGINFELAAATVDPLTHSTFDPRPLKVYMNALNIPYFYLEDSIMERAKNTEECKSICSYCSRMKRGMLYTCARNEGYNVLALGQHLDDLAESFMMSLFHNGLLRTMKANYTNMLDLKIMYM